MKSILLLLIFFSALMALDIEVVSWKIPNGQTALLEFNETEGLEYKSVVVGKKSFTIFSKPNNMEQKYVLIPFSYYEKAENKTLKIKYIQDGTTKIQRLLLKVINGKYEKEEIHVSSAKVNPKSKEVKQRISKEYNEAMKIYSNVTQKSYISKPFIAPLSSKITSAFGKARVYNGSLKGYHSGTDYRAAMGTEIVAANDAKVALVKKRFYSGGTVLLNHGQGIYTCYFHMSKFNVKEGQMVKQGDILGLSGKSGRVTGPHLHFSARINAVQVDPLQLISILNKNLLTGN
ncbi:M23 family metallopeptidase [Sulfurimonas sp. SAG-AH-194-C20]|nr:M23 family metallopeptidase [Sulfurimonas sp. SAG-AH-194-C20]MDF1878739.1 M23 family metallopeptidase [Sulfurimonas sp. SAG-AH-194-C20]